MEIVMYILFFMLFSVWLLFTRVGKGGKIDEALAAGLLEIDRCKPKVEKQEE